MKSFCEVKKNIYISCVIIISVVRGMVTLYSAGLVWRERRDGDGDGEKGWRDGRSHIEGVMESKIVTVK